MALSPEAERIVKAVQDETPADMVMMVPKSILIHITELLSTFDQRLHNISMKLSEVALVVEKHNQFYDVDQPALASRIDQMQQTLRDTSGKLGDVKTMLRKNYESGPLDELVEVKDR